MPITVHITPSIGTNSTVFPEHPFKLGYFSSADDENSLNEILKLRTGFDLKYIFFGEECSQNIIKPVWEDILLRFDNVKKILKETIEEDGWFSFKLFDFTEKNSNSIIGNKNALDIYLNRKKQTRNLKDMSKLITSDGIFYINHSPKILAILKNYNEKTNKPSVFVLFEASEKQSKYYLEGLEIIRETVEFILNQPNQKDYELHWRS